MSSETSTETVRQQPDSPAGSTSVSADSPIADRGRVRDAGGADARPGADPGLQPWQFFVLAALGFGTFVYGLSQIGVDTREVGGLPAVPTLVVGATHDTMDPAHMRWMAEQLPQGRYLHCPDGSHLAQFDDPQHYFPGLIDFLQSL